MAKRTADRTRTDSGAGHWPNGEMLFDRDNAPEQPQASRGTTYPVHCTHFPHPSPDTRIPDPGSQTILHPFLAKGPKPSTQNLTLHKPVLDPSHNFPPDKPSRTLPAGPTSLREPRVDAE